MAKESNVERFSQEPWIIRRLCVFLSKAELKSKKLMILNIRIIEYQLVIMFEL